MSSKGYRISESDIRQLMVNRGSWSTRASNYLLISPALGSTVVVCTAKLLPRANAFAIAPTRTTASYQEPGAEFFVSKPILPRIHPPSIPPCAFTTNGPSSSRVVKGTPGTSSHEPKTFPARRLQRRANRCARQLNEFHGSLRPIPVT